MIKEKALLATMKRAYKNGGYRVMEAAGVTTINTGVAVAIFKTTHLPRMILGLIAEHTGSIPTEIAYDCSPSNGTQIVMREAIKDSLKLFICDGSCEELHPTPLWWEGRRIFQKEDGTVLGVLGEHLMLLDDMTIVPQQMGERNVMCWQDGGEQLYIVAQSEKENVQLADLKYHQWILL